MAWSESVYRVVLVVAVAGLVRAGHHFIRLALLAALGLAGMYMLHMLAQDYNKITNRPRPAVQATRALIRAITKRDVSAHLDRVQDEQHEWSHGPLGHVLRKVLMQDPLGCARKLVCQLSASQRASLRPHEVAILRLVQREEQVEDLDAAAAAFREAQELGKSSKDPARCSARYTKCGVEARAVLRLLQSFSAVG